MADTGPFRILVTGSRSWSDSATLAWELGLAAGEGHRLGRPLVVVHGACPRGADRIADELARDHGIPVERHPADWLAHGRQAGFLRNAEMVAAGADLCLAFVAPCTIERCHIVRPHGSHGATHCADLAEKAGIPTRRYGNA